MRDERIEQAKDKIRSEMTLIILFGVAVSFIIKTFVFNLSLQETITEYVILLFAPIYQFVRMHMMKVSIYNQPGNNQPLRNLLTVIVILVVVSAIVIFNSVKNSELYDWENAIVSIMGFLALFIAVFFVANKFNKLRGQKYDKEFDDK